MSKVWFITGAGSGIGTGIAKAALRAGDRVVATGEALVKIAGMANPPKQFLRGQRCHRDDHFGPGRPLAGD